MGPLEIPCPTDNECMTQVIDILRQVYAISKQLAFEMGFLGADSNVTYNPTDAESEGNVSKHHYLPPLLHSLTSIHKNDPALMLPFASDTKTKANNNNNNNKNNNNNEIPQSLRQSLRQGPVDASESKLATSPYVNVYLENVRAQANCHAVLASSLEERRIMLGEGEGKYVMNPSPSPSPSSSSFLDNSNNNSNNSNSSSENNNGGYEQKLSVIDTGSLLDEQTATGENALKLLRHVVFSNAHVRTSLLQTVGRARADADKAADKTADKTADKYANSSKAHADSPMKANARTENETSVIAPLGRWIRLPFPFPLPLPLPLSILIIIFRDMDCNMAI